MVDGAERLIAVLLLVDTSGEDEGRLLLGVYDFECVWRRNTLEHISTISNHIQPYIQPYFQPYPTTSNHIQPHPTTSNQIYAKKGFS